MAERPLPPGVAIDLADGDRDLDGILALQQANLEVNLAADEAVRDGFVTVVHTRAILDHLHRHAPSIVARAGGEVIGYALAMVRECRKLVPALGPLFQLMETLEHEGRPVVARRFYVMGQICIARPWRGAGLFDALYAGHRRAYAGRFDLLVTDVAVRNGRSQRAHRRVGFVELARYSDATDDWTTVALELGPAAG